MNVESSSQLPDISVQNVKYLITVCWIFQNLDGYLLEHPKTVQKAHVFRSFTAVLFVSASSSLSFKNAIISTKSALRLFCSPSSYIYRHIHITWKVDDACHAKGVGLSTFTLV